MRSRSTVLLIVTWLISWLQLIHRGDSVAQPQAASFCYLSLTPFVNFASVVQVQKPRVAYIALVDAPCFEI